MRKRFSEGGYYLPLIHVPIHIYRKKILLYLSILVLVLNIFFNFLQPIEDTILFIIKLPLEINFYLTREIRFILCYHLLILENTRLKQELVNLQKKDIQSKELSQENERLKRLLDFKEESDYQLVACKVLARDNYLGNKVIIIDKGKNSGIKKYQAVIAGSGLVGKIIKVNKNTSSVRLISDPNLSVAVLIQRIRQQGLLEGSFFGECKVRYLDRDAQIEIDDVVITSGLGGVFPKGIMVGRIIYIGKEITGDLQYTILKPAIDLNRLEEVLVIAQ